MPVHPADAAHVALTPPQALFRDLADLGNLVFNMLAGPNVTVRRWPAYYMVYLELDGLCWELSRAAGPLSRGFAAADGIVDAARIGAANAGLARIGAHVQRIMELLAHSVRHGLVEHGAPGLTAVVQHHFAHDSTWHAAFQQGYQAGRVSSDGHFLARRVLPLDPYPAPGAGAARVHAVEHQVFDLLAAQSRKVQGRALRDVQQKLNHVLAAVGRFFAAQCPSVGELLHPRMT